MVDVRRSKVLLDGEYDQVRGIGDLTLIPRGRNKLLPGGWIGDDDEPPRLQTKGRWREQEGFLQRLPVGGRNLPRWIELFCGVAPVELIQKRVVGYWFGGHDVFQVDG